jgi:hypothetical protein
MVVQYVMVRPHELVEVHVEELVPRDNPPPINIGIFFAADN